MQVSSLPRAAPLAIEGPKRGPCVVPYLFDQATGGLGTRASGRGFGLELEFDLPLATRAQSIARIGQALHAAGLTRGPRQTFRNRRYTEQHEKGWQLTLDHSVDGGEVISPILYDERKAWETVATVLGILREHGAHTSPRTGGHIHVGVADFEDSKRRVRALRRLFLEHQTSLFEVAADPAVRAHRGTKYCRPLTRWDVRGPTTKEHALNTVDAFCGPASHVEFRLWDASLDPGVIQAQVKLSLALAASAAQAPRERGRMEEARSWLSQPNDVASESFDAFLARMFPRQEDRAQLDALRAVMQVSPRR